MKGVILASHGEMANGVLDTIKLFFGEQEQLAALCIHAGEDPEEYTKKIEATIKEVDKGDGVVIFTDLLFGSPCRCAGSLMSDSVDVIVGMNLPMLIEFLSQRQNENINLQEYINIGKDGIGNLKDIIK